MWGQAHPLTSVDEPCLDLCAQLNTCPPALSGNCQRRHYGVLGFGDIPNQLAFTGMVIVIASGLGIVFRERQIGASQ